MALSTLPKLDTPARMCIQMFTNTKYIYTQMFTNTKYIYTNVHKYQVHIQLPIHKCLQILKIIMQKYTDHSYLSNTDTQV